MGFGINKTNVAIDQLITLGKKPSLKDIKEWGAIATKLPILALPLGARILSENKDIRNFAKRATNKAGNFVVHNSLNYLRNLGH